MPPTSSTIGRGMLIASWVLFLGLLSLFFSDLLEKRNNPNPSPSSQRTAQGSKEVFLKSNRYGHYVASGKINDYPVVFLLDTGATGVSVPAAIADKIGLRTGQKQTVTTANGSINVYATNLHTVTLGNIELHDVSGHINPHMDNGEEILLGMSFLRHLEFTQRGNELILRQP